MLVLKLSGMHILLGSLSNPQQKIIGMAYQFGRANDVIFKCRGFSCNHRSEIDFFLLF